MERKKILIMALGIALLPAAWAVVSSLLGIECSWIALVTAGVFVAAGDKIEHAGKILLGLIAGLCWGILATLLMGKLNIYWNNNIVLFAVLFFFGGAAVLCSELLFRGKTYLPAWLGGFALTLGTLHTDGDLILQSIKIGFSMLIGVYYVGVGVKLFVRFFGKNKFGVK